MTLIGAVLGEWPVLHRGGPEHPALHRRRHDDARRGGLQGALRRRPQNGHGVESLHKAHFRFWKLEAVTRKFREAFVKRLEASVKLPEASGKLQEASEKLPMCTNTVFLYIERFTEVLPKLPEDSGKLPEAFQNLFGISGRILPSFEA